MKLQGADQLRARLEAMNRAPRGYGRDWGDAYVSVARPQIPVVTGKTRASVAVAHASDHGAEIAGSSVALWIDTGTHRHAITPASSGSLVWKRAGQTVFAKKVNHPGQRAKPWRHRALEEATRRAPLLGRVVDAWNRAA